MSVVHCIFLTPKTKGDFILDLEVHATIYKHFFKQENCPLEPKFSLAIGLIQSYVYEGKRDGDICVCLYIHRHALWHTQSVILLDKMK